MYRRDRPVSLDLIQGERRLRGQFVRRKPFCAQKGRECHRKAARMSRSDQLLGVCADAVFKPGGKRIRRLFENAAGSRQRAFALFEIAVPNGGCGAFHRFFGGGLGVRGFLVILGRLEFQNAIQMYTSKRGIVKFTHFSENADPRIKPGTTGFPRGGANAAGKYSPKKFCVALGTR